MVALILTIKLCLTVWAGTGTVFSANDKYNPNPSLACKSGQILNDRDLVVAHRTLPCGSKVVVCNVRTERCTSATVLDRGPYGKTKGDYTSVIDLSPGVASKIKHNGFEPVTVTYVIREKLKLPVVKKRPIRNVS